MAKGGALGAGPNAGYQYGTGQYGTSQYGTGTGAPDAAGEPAWLREVRTSLSVNAQLVLYGNIRDNFPRPVGAGWDMPTITDYLWWALRREGYPFLVVVDAVTGIRALPAGAENSPAFLDVAGRRTSAGRPELAEVIDILTAVAEAEGRCAVVVDYASRLVADSARLEPTEHDFFATCEWLSHQASPRSPQGGDPLYNPIIWVVNHDRDLPVWLTAGNDAIRKIAVPLPDFGVRRQAAQWLAPSLPGYTAASDEIRYGLPDRLAEQTEGLGLHSMLEITRLARRLGTPVEGVDEAVRCYRVGIHDNPWRAAHLRSRLAGAATTIRSRVRGQDEAIQHSVDILIRSVLGLSGAHVGGNATRPRGVLFFAGPTGVGKTQLAKELTQTVFGDERAYIRFDMSEFAAEHAADRLIGAPPGYIGHDAGGELTNAVRERPFSLILFDEIEKAHPRILDKFLQILDDGRLTDGSGSTVYFTESMIVFTSNLGVAAVEPGGERRALVTPDMPRAELTERVTAAVTRHFVSELNRPELLNRLGDNIVVFNFIGPAAGEEIFDRLVEHIGARLAKEQDMTLRLAPRARETLLAAATADLSNGGRGIGSVLETALVNPLAREIFARPAAPGRLVTVTDADHRDGVWSLALRYSDPATGSGPAAGAGPGPGPIPEPAPGSAGWGRGGTGWGAR
jgi:hypothetical protein